MRRAAAMVYQAARTAATAALVAAVRALALEPLAAMAAVAAVVPIPLVDPRDPMLLTREAFRYRALLIIMVFWVDRKVIKREILVQITASFEAAVAVAALAVPDKHTETAALAAAVAAAAHIQLEWTADKAQLKLVTAVTAATAGKAIAAV